MIACAEFLAMINRAATLTRAERGLLVGHTLDCESCAAKMSQIVDRAIHQVSPERLQQILAIAVDDMADPEYLSERKRRGNPHSED